MANFNKAINKILEHEGGFVNNPADRGGATNWGITQKTFESYIGRPATLDEIEFMPRNVAIDIYKMKYWSEVKGDQISNYAVAVVIFDQAVNRGPRSAIIQAQKVLGLSQDGSLGPNTLKALNSVNPESFIDNYLQESEDFYLRIVARDPSQEVFIKGWLHRVASLEDYAMANIGTLGISFGVVALLGIAGYLIYTNFDKIEKKVFA